MICQATSLFQMNRRTIAPTVAPMSPAPRCGAYMPMESPIKVARNAPATPSTIVSKNPCGLFAPGVILLAVTVLTSLDRGDLDDLGFSVEVEKLVLSRARRALEAGCDSFVTNDLALRQIAGLSVVVLDDLAGDPQGLARGK